MDGFFGPSAEMKGSKEKKEICQFFFVQVPKKFPTVDQFVFHASKKEKKVWIKKKPENLAFSSNQEQFYLGIKTLSTT
jgi:hypothetical protein